MKKTLNIFGSCLVIVGMVFMLGAAGMSDTCTGSLDCVVNRAATGLAFVAVGAVVASLAEIQKHKENR